MANLQILCLCCGDETVSHNRRVLTSENTSHIISGLSYILKRGVDSASKQYTETDVQNLLYGKCSSAGFVCRNCFTVLNGFSKKECTLMQKSKKVIDIIDLLMVVRGDENVTNEADQLGHNVSIGSK